MNLKEIREIVDLITEKGIAEFELERSGVRLRISRNQPLRGAEFGATLPAYAAAPAPASAGPRSTLPEAASIPPPGASAGAAPPTGDLVVIRSPMVGTYYSAPGQDTPPFVSVGDRVRPGQVICIIEAMKLMNEIEAEFEGEVVQCHVENGQPVEFGEPLFDIRSAGPAKKR